MAGAYVNDVFVEVVDGSNSTTVAATITGVTAGNTLVAHISWGDPSFTTITTTCSVSDGSAFTSGDSRRIDTDNTQASQPFYRENVGSGSHTVTATFDIASIATAVPYRSIRVYEFSGLATSGSLDQSTGQFQASPGTGSDGISSSATVSTTNANDFVVGLNNETSSGTGAGTTAGTGFTLVTGLHSLNGEYKNVSATGAQTATLTQSSNEHRITHVIAFKQAAAAAAATNYMSLLGVGT